MPRTKVPRRRTTIRETSQLSDEQKDLIQRLDALHITKQKTLREFYEAKKKQLKENFEMLREIFQQDLDKTMGQMREETLKKTTAPPESHTSSIKRMQSATKTRLSISSQKDDGYVTDAVNANAGSIRRSRRLSRSVSRSNYSHHHSKIRTPSVMGPRIQLKGRRSSSASSVMGPPRSSRMRYKTPMNRVVGGLQYPPITPKIVPDTPISVLRRPRQGETVVSLSGSPLLVNSNFDFQANCNIPLSDGTVVSLLPNKLKDSSVLNLPIDYMRPETKRELKTLQDNIQTYLKIMSSNSNKRH